MSGYDCLIRRRFTRLSLRRLSALKGSREGKGEAICAELHCCIVYVTNQQETVSNFRHRLSLVRRDIMSVLKRISGKHRRNINCHEGNKSRYFYCYYVS